MASATELTSLFYELLESKGNDQDALIERAINLRQPLHIYLPTPPVDSAISTSYMRAFVEVQQKVNRLAAQARFGEPNASRLTLDLKRQLELNVVVTGGSSDFKLDLTPVLQKMLGKMTGKQIALTIVAVALIAGTTWGVNTFLETQKVAKLEEIRSQEHIAALEALKFATHEDMERFNRLMETVELNIEFGQQTLEVVKGLYDEVLKAAAETNVSEINGQVVSGQVADLLTLSTKTASETSPRVERVRVIDIRTEDVLNPHVELEAVADATQVYKFNVGDSLFAAEDREALFRSLESGTPVLVELEVTTTDGLVKSTKFLRVIREQP